MSPTTIIKSVSENEKAEIGKGSSLSSSSKMRKEGGGGVKNATECILYLTFL